jgi:YegS/Rv2252/BmrU family lipid kinase
VRERLETESSAVDAVFTIGGDGTIMEVASALAEAAHPPLGILPLGTANVLARSLGIPLRPADAVRALLDGHVQAIDLGHIVGGPRFAIGLGVGLDATMIGSTPASLKRRFSYFAYVWSAIRAGLRMERFSARVTMDGTTHEFVTSSVLVANFGTVLGDLLCFGNAIVPRDGRLDVCVYSPRSRLDAVRILWRMLAGDVGCDRCVCIVSGRHIQIETDPPRPAQADGELIGLTPVKIHVEPQALRLLVPRSGPRRRGIRRFATARTHGDLVES